MHVYVRITYHTGGTILAEVVGTFIDLFRAGRLGPAVRTDTVELS